MKKINEPISLSSGKINTIKNKLCGQSDRQNSINRASNIYDKQQTLCRQNFIQTGRLRP